MKTRFSSNEDFLPFCRGNTHLDLSHCELESTEELIHFLKDSPGISSVDLSGNFLSSEDVALLVRKSNLISLNLSLNFIGNAGAKAIAESTSLRIINLSDNCVDDKGISYFKKNNTLLILDLSENLIEADLSNILTHIRSNIRSCSAIPTKYFLSHLNIQEEVLDLSATDFSAANIPCLNNFLKCYPGIARVDFTNVSFEVKDLALLTSLSLSSLKLTIHSELEESLKILRTNPNKNLVAIDIESRPIKSLILNYEQNKKENFLNLYLLCRLLYAGFQSPLSLISQYLNFDLLRVIVPHLIKLIIPPNQRKGSLTFFQSISASGSHTNETASTSQRKNTH